MISFHQRGLVLPDEVIDASEASGTAILVLAKVVRASRVAPPSHVLRGHHIVVLCFE